MAGIEHRAILTLIQQPMEAVMAREFIRKNRRQILRIIAIAWAVGSSLGRGMAGEKQPEKAKDVAEQIVDTMNAIFGKHPGYRAVHAKGIVCEGEFTPAPTAAGLSRAPHLKVEGKPVRVTVRFSDSTGIPTVPDGSPSANPHGLAVRFHLPEGGSTDIVSNAYNGFAVSTAEEFLALLQALAESGQDVPKPKPIEKFLATHPKAAKVITAPKPTPVSLATEPYFGVNAFLFTNRDGKTRYGRYQFRPEAGAQFLSDEDAAKQPANFLIDELHTRLSKGPVKFRLVVQLGAEGDPVNDATAVWPDDRPTVELGVLSINQPVRDNEAAQRGLAFDPTRLVDGIEASDDPILEARSSIYAVSRRHRR
jgi:catalase